MNAIQHADYFLRDARYAKGKVAVSCPSSTGYKTRAACLAEALANGRYTGREHAYIMSPKRAEKFIDLYAKGYDASYITYKLIPPIQQPNEGEKHANNS